MRNSQARIRPLWGSLAALVAAAVATVAAASGRGERPGSAGVREIELGGFAVEHELVLPGSPETIYDAITGDVSGWWDHTFSESPRRLYMEAKPGGGFYEIFDEAGNGVQHATVTFAERGKRLRFEGPLGFSGHALRMVHTYEFEAAGDSTRLKLSVHGAGELQDGWAEAVDGVWHHFLVERFKPYVEEGRHLRR